MYQVRYTWYLYTTKLYIHYFSFDLGYFNFDFSYFDFDLIFNSSFISFVALLICILISIQHSLNLYIHLLLVEANKFTA